MLAQWTWKAVAIAAVTLLAIGLVGCGKKTTTTVPNAAAATDTNKDEPIKLGAVFGMSGPNEAYGFSQHAGLILAAQQINEAGGINGHKLELQVRHTDGDKDQAISVVNNLIDKENVLAIIGPTFSAEMFAAGPIANQKGVPILGVSSMVGGSTDLGKYVFRKALSEESVLPAMVKVAREKVKVTSAALLFDNQDEFARSGGDIFRKALEKEGIKIVDSGTFGTADQDFAAQIDKALAAKPDGIFISSLYPAGSQLLIQLRAQGYTGPVFGGNGFNSAKVLEIPNNAAENLIVGSPWFAGAAIPQATRLVAAYQRLWGKTPDQFAAQAYDGMMLLAKAIDQANTTADRDKVRDALAAITDKERNLVQVPFVLQVQGGRYVELK